MSKVAQIIRAALASPSSAACRRPAQVFRGVLSGSPCRDRQPHSGGGRVPELRLYASLREALGGKQSTSSAAFAAEEFLPRFEATSPAAEARIIAPEGDALIARVWRGYTRPEHAELYEAMLKPELLPGIGKVKGYQGSYLLRRQVGGEVEFITIMLWESLEALRAVAGPDYETAIVPEERRQYLSHYEQESAHYEVAATHVGGRPGGKMAGIDSAI